MSDQPSDQDMRVIRQFMPSIKQKMRERQQRKQFVPRDPNAKFCKICGEKILIVLKDDAKYCPDCQKHLDDGETALISVDNRFAFLKSNGNVHAMKLMGQVVEVPIGVMDRIKKKFESETAANN